MSESHEGKSPASASSSSSSSMFSPVWSCDSPAVGHSTGKVPFSWEKEPGVPKLKVSSAPKWVPSSSPGEHHHQRRHHLLGQEEQVRQHRLRPPPMFSSKPPEFSRAHRKKSEKDPFMAAMVECTKHEKKKTKLERTISMFSCMNSCSTKESHVSMPVLRSKSMGSSSNEILNIKVDQKLKQYGSSRSLDGSDQRLLYSPWVPPVKEDKQQEQEHSTALVEWVQLDHYPFTIS